MAWHKAAGLTRDIYLPDHITFVVDLIPLGQVRQRPGFKLWPNPVGIDHETGNTNPNTGAYMHSNYLDIGAPDNYGDPQYLSYHTCSDEDTIVQKIPLDEVTYQAACGACRGNYGAHSNEMAVSSNYDKAKCRDTAEWGRAAIMEAAGVPPVEASITFHWDHNNVYSGGPTDPRRHKCPYYMLFIDDYAPTFKRRVLEKHAIIVAKRAERENPVPVTPPVEWDKPELPTNYSRTAVSERPADNMKYGGRTVYICQRAFKCVSEKGASRLTIPGTRQQGAKAAGPRVGPDEKVFALGLWVNPNDKRTYILEETGAWLAAAQFTPRVRIDPRSAE